MASKRLKRKKSKQWDLATASPRQAIKSHSQKPSKPPISRRRKWLYRLTALVLVPLLFFGLLESGLRLAGFGFPTGFFLGPDKNGTYMTNPRFGWRFFPSALARTPIPSFLSAKPEGTIRIFVLGSSAAQAVPNPAFSFARILETMLQEQYPNEKIEVINAAMTAINSHAAREIARDCAAHQPDLFVVYMGNNEVVGPFGPGTVFDRWSPNLRVIRANLWLKSTRTGQLLDKAVGHFHAAAPNTAWRGMEMFLDNPVAANDPRLAAVDANFRQNLKDICAIAREAKAAVVLSTVAVNLKDCPPFASAHRGNLTAEELEKWKTLYQQGIAQETNKEWAAALEQYEAAAQLDDRYAELAFRRGRCLSALDRSAEAAKQFQAACDLDALRFRADSKINAAIGEVAAAEKAAGVRLADAEAALAQYEASADGIPGKELFYEHVHLTFEGNYQLARAVLNQVEAALPRLADTRKSDVLLTLQQCKERLSLTPWDEYQLASQMAEVTSRPPFTNQLDHADRQALAQQQAASLGKLASTPEALRDARKVYEAALEKTPDDWHLHHRFGKLAMADGDSELAAKHFRFAIDKYPLEPMLYVDLGNAEYRNGKSKEAIANLKKALEFDPGFALAHYNLGIVLVSCNRYNEALSHYRRSLEIDPHNEAAHYNLAVALDHCTQTEQAIVHYRKALKIKPNFLEARRELQTLLNGSGPAGNSPNVLP